LILKRVFDNFISKKRGITWLASLLYYKRLLKLEKRSSLACLSFEFDEAVFEAKVSLKATTDSLHDESR
jgi:hypothetical protein